MKHILFVLLILSFGFGNSMGQQHKYQQLREKTTTPPYSLQKIKKWIQEIPENDSNSDEFQDEVLQALPASIYKQMTVREKFTYTMIHPEVYSQNCSVYIPPTDGEKRIFGYLTSWAGENVWSDRQLNFLRNNKDSVLALIRESVARSKWIGVNYKEAIVEMGAWEAIPFIINYYQNNKQDRDALTTLMLLMQAGKYKPFVTSISYKKLYTNETEYEITLLFNTANETLILNRAQSYYAEKSKHASVGK